MSLCTKGAFVLLVHLAGCQVTELKKYFKQRTPVVSLSDPGLKCCGGSSAHGFVGHGLVELLGLVFSD